MSKTFFNICAILMSATIAGMNASAQSPVSSGPVKVRAHYEILPPGAENSVGYELTILDEPTRNDSLSACNYVIASRLNDDPEGDVWFSAYFDGNFYRFRNDSFMEWHVGDDASAARSGQLRSELFVNALPSVVAADVSKIIDGNDPAYKYDTTLYDDGSSAHEGYEERQGYRLRDFKYWMGKDGRPLYVETISSPGEQTEQTVTVTYIYDGEQPEAISEDLLARMFPEAFKNFRGEHFNISSMKGRPMPTYSLPKTDGRRLSHRRGEPYDAATLIAFIAPERETVEKTRTIAKSYESESGTDVNLVLAFIDNDVPAITEASGRLGRWEDMAYSSETLARSCGIRSFPTLVLCNADGRIVNFADNLNQDTSEIVLILCGGSDAE